MADNRGDNSAEERADLILKIDHRNAPIMRVPDILIGNGAPDAVRFWFRIARRHREKSGATVREAELAPFYIRKI